MPVDQFDGAQACRGHAFMAAGHGDIGYLAIMRFAGTRHALQDIAAIAVGEDRPLMVVLEPFELLLDVDLQPDHEAALTQMMSIAFVKHGAGAHREHHAVAAATLVQVRAFALTEAGLAFDIEDGRHRHPGMRLDFLVEVDEGQAVMVGQSTSDRGLAGAGRTDEEQVARGIHAQMLAKSGTMNERVLIAGCGDVGTRVAQRLAARGDTVFALRRSATPGVVDGIGWLRGDLVTNAGLDALPPVSQLVFAATPATGDEAAYRAIFLDGLRHVLSALDVDALRRVVFVSSSAVYGEHGGDRVDETTPTAPLRFNGEVLVEAERWLAAQAPRTISLRLAGLYGPGRTRLFDSLRAGAASVPRGEPVYANRIHVDDAAAAIAHLLAIPEPDACYLGVDDTPLPIDVLYDYLAALLDAPLPGPGVAPAGVGNKRLDNARLRASGFDFRWPDARAGYADLLRR
jgi:nucleoside-diphosphate-sugar epimerase